MKVTLHVSFNLDLKRFLWHTAEQTWQKLNIIFMVVLIIARKYELMCFRHLGMSTLHLHRELFYRVHHVRPERTDSSRENSFKTYLCLFFGTVV